MSNKLFVVEALHSTGHGPNASVLHMTESLAAAFETLMRAEELGYQFYRDDHVAITCMKIGTVYTKKGPGSRTFIMVRRFRGVGDFEDEWFDESSQHALEEMGLL